MATADALKDRAIAAIDAIAADLIEASHSIHAHPELNYEEHHAHRVLTDMLGDAGLGPTRGAYELSTAFEVTAGGRGPTVGVLCEYDALPGIGHGCGHNIIAPAGLGAGIALATIAEDAGGRLRLLGTPAEEGGGGKIEMARRGAFADLDAAMMIHPADADHAKMSAIAIQQLFVRYADVPWQPLEVPGLPSGLQIRPLSKDPSDGACSAIKSRLYASMAAESVKA